MKHIILICLLAFASSVYALQIIWDRSGASDSSHYGYNILPLGDQNNDGFADWAVFGGGHGTAGQPNEAVLEFFHGGSTLSTIPYKTIRGQMGVWDLLYADVVGDINHDGIQDIEILKRFPSDYLHNHDEIYLGGDQSDTIPTMTFTEGWHDGFLPLGDFNGDGYDDIAIFCDDVNRSFVYYGGSSPDSIVDWAVSDLPVAPFSAFPYTAGDLNGDGFSDWVSCESNSMTTYIFLGGANPDTVPAYTWPNMAHWPLAIVNDMNGDHFDELVYWNRELHFGRPVMRSTPDMVFGFGCGEGVAQNGTGVGDINGDGYGDMVLYRTNCDDWPGGLGLYLGHPWINPGAVVFIRGEGWQNLHGIGAAAGLGDVNGDGIDDWAIGSWDDRVEAGWRGRCIVIKGDSTMRVDVGDPFILPPASFSLSAYPNPFNATTTISFTLPKTGNVDLNVYDVTGRVVRKLAGGHIGPPLQAGEHRMEFDGGDLPSGIYFVRLQSGTVAQTEKIVLLR